MECLDCERCQRKILRMAHVARERRLRAASGLRLGREPRGFSAELEMHLGDLHDPDLEQGCAEEWEVRELRGFAMRRGRKGRILRMARAKAAKQLRSAAFRQPELESSISVMPGRNLFSRRAGNNHHVERCSMCKPGRHHGPGGKKALKKCRAGGVVRKRWLDVVQEARDMEKADALRSVDPAETSLQLITPVLVKPLLSTQGSVNAIPAESSLIVVWKPPPTLFVARAKTRKQNNRRRCAGCACCPADRSSIAGAVADSRSPTFSDFVMVGSNADSDEWEVL